MWRGTEQLLLKTPINQCLNWTIKSFTKPQNIVPYEHSNLNRLIEIRVCADKFSARPGRLNATVNKLGIYVTYTPLSSIHFIAHCSISCKPHKKFQNFVRPTSSPRQLWPQNRKKNSDHSFFFQSKEQVVVQRGQIRRIVWVIKILEAQVGQILLGCMCPVSRDIVVQAQDYVEIFPAAYFLQIILSPAEISNTKYY